MSLEKIRSEIDRIDNQLLILFQKRMMSARKIAQFKKENKLPILDRQREERIIESLSTTTYESEFFRALFTISRGYQTFLNFQKNLLLIGMMGCGKTTVGKVLSHKMSVKFIDIDEYIEKTVGMSVNEIFQNHGMEYFRKLEEQHILDVIENSPQIISPGGGIVLNDSLMQRISKNSLVVFLNPPVEKIASWIDIDTRPLVNSKSDVLNIYNARLHLYKKYADFEIDSAESIDNVADLIIQKLQSTVDYY